MRCGFYFYPRPPRGGRLEPEFTLHCSALFLSTPSARRATPPVEPKQLIHFYFYPRPPRGGRRVYHRDHEDRHRISIHALREEGDSCPASSSCRPTLFLSTPSARRATQDLGGGVHSEVISIHALREEGDATTCRTAAARTISIHALREEGDRRWLRMCVGASTFLSTPSARRATLAARDAVKHYLISIHALREEGDVCGTSRTPAAPYFYPRPPRGGRHGAGAQGCQLCGISIHALREEGDVAAALQAKVEQLFLSTPSARRATRSKEKLLQAFEDFYPRPPRGGRQQKQRQNLYFQTNYTTFCTNLEEP